MLPILIDEKIHYSITKMIDSVSYTSNTMGTMWVTRSFEPPPPPRCTVYGTHISTLLPSHTAFFSYGCGIYPWYSCSPCPGVCIPHVDLYGAYFFVFACFFVSTSNYKIRIQQKPGLLRGRCHPPMLASSNAGRLLGQAHAMYTLLFEYTPALFLIGPLVGECGWSACSAEVGRKVLQYIYVIATHLLYEFRYNIEYLRTLGTTVLVWDKLYDILPGRCHVEESCEALLARLVATMRTLHLICFSF